MKSIDTFFLLFLAASLASTVILLLLLLARKLFLKRLSPRILHALWFIVLIKLLVPFAPQSPVSLFNLIPQALPVEWSLEQKNTLPMLSSESDSSTKVTVTDSGEKPCVQTLSRSVRENKVRLLHSSLLKRTSMRKFAMG